MEVAIGVTSGGQKTIQSGFFDAEFGEQLRPPLLRDIRDTDPAGGQVCQCVILTQMENALCVAGVGSRLADDRVVECDNNGRSPVDIAAIVHFEAQKHRPQVRVG